MSKSTTFAEFIRRVATATSGRPRVAGGYGPVMRRVVRVGLREPRLYSQFDCDNICQSVMASSFVRAAAAQFDLERPYELLRLLGGHDPPQVVNSIGNRSQSTSPWPPG